MPVRAGLPCPDPCRMAVDSYRLGRTIRWDPKKEEASA